MSEAEVVSSLKRHLRSTGIAGISPSSIIVDSDGSYTTSRYRSALEPMASLKVNGYRLDMICGVRSPQNALIFGFEVKPSFGEWREGVSQAANYRSAVHQSYLAIPKDRNKATTDLERQARSLGVGVLLRDNKQWHEAVEAEDPRPIPNKVDITQRLLDGVPLARQLQLNHPVELLGRSASSSQLPKRFALTAPRTALARFGCRRYSQARNQRCPITWLD